MIAARVAYVLWLVALLLALALMFATGNSMAMIGLLFIAAGLAGRALFWWGKTGWKVAR